MTVPSVETVTVQPGAHAAERRRRLISAVLTSGASKVFALLVQIFALPLALKVLGEGRYTAFLTLQSAVGWISIFGLGLIPSLPKFIAAARAAQDRQGERNLVMSAITALLLLSTLVFTGLAIVGFAVGPQTLVSVGGIAPNELAIGYFVAAAASCLSFFGSVEPAIRAGSQELHYANIAALIANVVVLAALFLFTNHPLPLWAFFFLLNFPTSILQILDMGLLMIQRPYLVRGRFHFMNTAKSISSHSNNALMIQISYALIMYLPTFAMAHLSTTHETTIFGSVALELFFAIASMNLIFQPLIQAMANAHSHNDAGWVSRGYRRSLFLVSAIGVVAMVLGAAAGPWVMRHWLGHGMEMSHLLGGAFGFYFLMLCLSLLHFYVLSALGALPGLGKVYLFQGVVALFLGATLCVWYGAEGMVIGLALGLTATGWFFPFAVRRELKSMRSSGASAAGCGPDSVARS